MVALRRDESGLSPAVKILGGPREEIATVGGAEAPLEEMRVHCLRLRIASAFVLYQELLEDVHQELTAALADPQPQHIGAIDLVEDGDLRIERIGRCVGVVVHVLNRGQDGATVEAEGADLVNAHVGHAVGELDGAIRG